MKKSISELVSFWSLVGFGKAATELQTFRNRKITKKMCMYGYRGQVHFVIRNLFPVLHSFLKCPIPALYLLAVTYVPSTVMSLLFIQYHFIVVDNPETYQALLDSWCPDNGHIRVYLTDTGEEALLLPEWLRLRMIRAASHRVVDAGTQPLNMKPCRKLSPSVVSHMLKC